MHRVFCIKQGWWGTQKLAMVEPCPPIWLNEKRKKLSFWNQVRRQLWMISMPREPCSWRDTTSARGEELILLILILLLLISKGKTTTKKAREIKASPGSGWRREENGIWPRHLENNYPRHYNYNCRIIEQIPVASDKHYIHIICHLRHFL